MKALMKSHLNSKSFTSLDHDIFISMMIMMMTSVVSVNLENNKEFNTLTLLALNWCLEHKST